MQTIENVDPQEIAKFSRLAAEWWNPHGACKPLHDINPLRLQFIQENSSIAGAKILDIGCGGGLLSEALAKRGAEVTAIDKSEEAINIAKLHSSQQSITATIDYQLSTAEMLATTHAGYFDIITCMELLEHIPGPAGLIHACAQLVKPQGKIFFSTINRTFKAYLLAIIGAEYVLKLLPKGTHDYAKFIRPSELSTWTRNNHLEIKLFKGLQYTPLTHHHQLNDDLSVNYLTYCIKKNCDDAAEKN